MMLDMRYERCPSEDEGRRERERNFDSKLMGDCGHRMP
jgi:hypothetical protein